MTPDFQRLAGAAGGALVAAVAVLALAEAGLRLSIPASSGGSIYEYTLQTQRYKVMKPDASVIAWGKELRTNELGFRDKARSIPPKQPGELRIVVLGSSFTVSAGVDYDDIYTSQLERRLRQLHPGVRVINLAVGGYNPVQYSLVLQEVGLALQPDLVLVALFPDSDFRMDIYEENRRVAEGKAPPARPSPWYEEAYTYRAYGSRIVDKVKSVLHKPAGRADPAQGRRGWDENVAALQRIARTSQEHGLPLRVAILPHTFNFEKQRGEFARIERMCREQQLPCFNLLEPFIAARVPEATLRLNALDSHPNERYSAIVAELLAAHLRPTLPLPSQNWATAATLRRAEFQKP